MKCKQCGEENGDAKRTCSRCGAFLEGYTLNNVTGEYGYRGADGNFYKSEEEYRSQSSAAVQSAIDHAKEELPKVFILREQYDKLDPAVIREKQEEAHCILVPVERDEMDRILQEAVVYTPMLEMPKLPDFKMLQPAVYDVPHVKGGRYHEPPRDLKKKKKAKRRQQKQARRRK